MIGKQIKRRPLFPVLMMLLMLAGCGFAVLFTDSIARNAKAVEDLYANVELEFRVLPGAGSDGSLGMPVELGERIMALPEVAEVYYDLLCPTAMETEIPEFYFFLEAYGTSDVEIFAKNHMLTVTFGEGYKAEDFKENPSLCLVEKNVADYLGLSVGDVISLAGSKSLNSVVSNLHFLPYTVAGVWTASENMYVNGGFILAGEELLKEKGLMYTKEIRREWQKYTAFSFQTDPAYNREFERIYSDIKTMLDNKGSYTLYSSNRELQLSVRPLENKLETQKALLLPVLLILGLLLVIVSALAVTTLAPSVLIRMLLGENRGRVLVTEWLLCVGELLCAAVPSIIAGVLLAALGFGVKTAVLFLVAEIMASVCVMIPSLMIRCKGSLVAQYQAREE